jgi:hypothetical protein
MDPRDKSRKTDPGPGPRLKDGQGIVSLPADGLTEEIDSEWGAESDATPVWPTPPGILALARSDTHIAPKETDPAATEPRRLAKRPRRDSKPPAGISPIGSPRPGGPARASKPPAASGSAKGIASPVFPVGADKPAAARPARDLKSDPVAARARPDPPGAAAAFAAAPRPASKAKESEPIRARSEPPREVEVHEASLAEAEDVPAVPEGGGEAPQVQADEAAAGAAVPFELARPKSVRPAASLSPITKGPAPSAGEAVVARAQAAPAGTRRWWFVGAVALLVVAGTWAATRGGDRTPSTLPPLPASTQATPKADPPTRATSNRTAPPPELPSAPPSRAEPTREQPAAADGSVVQVTVSVNPPDAALFRPGKPPFSQPATFEVKRGQRIVVDIARDGYVARRVRLDGSTANVEVTLAKAPKAFAPRDPGGASEPPAEPAPSGE